MANSEPSPSGKPASTRLKRSLSVGMLTVYGVGTIIGGGFYALIGKVSVHAGLLTPLAFLAAALIATFSAISYAELSARFPFSAGEAKYVSAAFRRPRFADLVGWSVIATGVVSAATLAVAFAGFLNTLTGANEWIAIACMVVGLGLVAAWGINESAWLALVITVIEVVGLMAVVFYSVDSLPQLSQRWRDAQPLAMGPAMFGVMFGAYLAFYSFVGFEDMVNLAEEVKQPERSLPIAIFASLAITTVIYAAVTVCVVAAVDPKALADSKSPLSLVFPDGGVAAAMISSVGMLSGVNGALVQIVMSTRVAYGLADRGSAPSWLAKISPRTQTPIYSTCLMTSVVLALALWFPIEHLARATSTILLLVYAAVNLALVRLKFTADAHSSVGPSYPVAIPIIGAACCIAFVIFNAVAVLL